MWTYTNQGKRGKKMNEIMLISKINSQDYSEEKRKIFFSIGGINLPSVENRIMDILKGQGLPSEDITLKYNGIELSIRSQDIPIMIQSLCKENISIYSVYQFYNPI